MNKQPNFHCPTCRDMGYVGSSIKLNVCPKCHGRPYAQRDKTMNPWQERLIQEKVDLIEKILKLEDFLDSERVPSVATNQRDLLEQQLNVMQKYRDILELRIGTTTESVKT